MSKYDKALQALKRAGFSPGMVGEADDPCIYIMVRPNDTGRAHEMRLHDLEIGWWATKYQWENA
tara:strand:+ start:684 stop:875 length:192 start_codon:yes stop_codon:yes gene_type:complete